MPDRSRSRKAHSARVADLRTSALWTPDADEGYAAHKLYTAASDDGVHGSAVRFNAPITIVGRIGDLVASRVLPGYRTPSDFWRDASYHRLRYWAEHMTDREAAESILRSLTLLEVEQTANNYLSEIQQFNATINKIQEYVSVAASSKLPRKLTEQFLDRMKEAAEDMTEPFRSKLLEKLGEL